MGNSKSKNSGQAGHEKLDENDARYFDKVEQRNKVSDGKRRFGRRNHKTSSDQASEGTKAGGIMDPPESAIHTGPYPNMPSAMDTSRSGVRGRTAMLERAGDVTPTSLNGGYHSSTAAPTPAAGPLSPHTTLPIRGSIERSKSEKERKKKRRSRFRSSRADKSVKSLGSVGSSRSSKSDGAGSLRPPPAATSLFSRQNRSRASSDDHGALVKSKSERFEKPRRRGSTQSAKSEHRGVEKHKAEQKAKKEPVVDYYTEMIAEATGAGSTAFDAPGNSGQPEKRKQKHGHRDENRAFDAMLPSGLVWADIPRGGKVTCLALSPDVPSHSPYYTAPLLLAVGTDDGFVAVIEVLDDGSNAVGGINGTIDLLMSKKKKYGSVRELPREGKVRSLDFSPDGRSLVVGGDDCTAAIVDVGIPSRDEISTPGGANAAKARPLPPLRIVQETEREDRVYATRFSPDGAVIAIGGFDGMVAIAAAPTEERRRRGSEMSESSTMDLIAEIPRLGLVLSVDWASDGSLLAIGGSDKRAAIVSVIHSDGSLAGNTTATTAGNIGFEVLGEIQRPASVQCVRWSPDGTHLAVGGHDGAVAIVDLHTRSIVKEIVRGGGKLSGIGNKQTAGNCRINGVCWSPDGAFLAIGGSDDACAIVETKSFVLVHEIQRSGHVTCVEWGSRSRQNGNEAGGRYLAVGGDDRAVAILKTGVEDDDVSNAGSYSTTESESVASSAASEASSEWVLSEGSFRDMDDADFGLRAGGGSKVKTDDKVMILNATFSRCDEETGRSEYLAVTGNDNRVTVISTDDWIVVTEMIFSKPIQAMDFSNNNEQLALGGDDCIVYVVSIETWDKIAEFAASSPIFSLGYSPKDERLAVGTSDGMLTFLDSAKNFSVAGEMDSNDSPILSMDWSINGKHMAVGRNDASVTVHESQSVYSNFFVPQTELRRGGGAPVHAVAFGDGGKFLAVGGGDWTVAIYGLKGGWTLVHEIKMGGWVFALSWSADSRYLGFGGTDLASGGRIVDTISWQPVEELGGGSLKIPGIGVGEETTSMDWSADGLWFVASGKSGKSRIVNTETWEVEQCIDHQNPLESVTRPNQTLGDEFDPNTSTPDLGLPQSASQGTQSILADLAASESARSPVEDEKTLDKAIFSTQNTESNPNQTHHGYKSDGHFTFEDERDVDWPDRRIILKFLEVCDKFLPPYEDEDPPNLLRLFVPCILMLQVHIKWVGAMHKDIRRVVERLDSGQPLSSLHRVLASAISVMERLLVDKENFEQWWGSCRKFQLTQEDTNMIVAWNDAWMKVEEESPVVDINLLAIADS